ncbi:MAG: amino acid permease [Chitinophagales bacterium]
MADIFRKKDIGRVLKDAEEGLGDSEKTGLHKTLGVRDLTAFGIAAVVGAGIFSSIGKASYDGGPGIILLFIFVAIACGFSAFCYAEFASLVPVSGSAYTYSYVAFGEIIAWIIGWDLLMEYAIGNIAVAISWSDYFTSMLEGFHIHVPDFLTMDYWTARDGFAAVAEKLNTGAVLSNLDPAAQAQYLAWTGAPQLLGLRLICDLPAFFIVGIITYITYRGIKESKTSANLMVALKLGVIFLVIVLGSFYVNPHNWNPFLPNGIAGVLKGTAAVFFAYIGFDAISTTAEECKNPQRDLPRGMIYALIICTIIYVLIALVLTGMVKYDSLNVGDPLAYVFKLVKQDWMAGIVAVSAVIATASVLLVFQVGQPRIWMSMSRDGLLPKVFSKIHPTFKTPSFSTILTGLVVGIPALFLNLTTVIDLTSVGTLFAFVLVCGGVLRLSLFPNPPQGSFKTPYYSGRYVMPLLLIAGLFLAYKFNYENVSDLLHNRTIVAADDYQQKLTPEMSDRMAAWLTVNKVSYETKYKSNIVDLETISEDGYKKLMRAMQLPEADLYVYGWTSFRHHFMMWLFLVIAGLVTLATVWKSLSLIPVLGMLSCMYLLSESGVTNWERFLAWLVVGFVVYFLYGYRKSKLAAVQTEDIAGWLK